MLVMENQNILIIFIFKTYSKVFLSGDKWDFSILRNRIVPDIPISDYQQLLQIG